LSFLINVLFFVVGNLNQAGNTPVNNIGGGYGGANPNINTCQTGPNNVHLMAGQMQHMSARMANGQQTMTQQQHANISMQSQNNQVIDVTILYLLFQNHIFMFKNFKKFRNFYLKGNLD